MTAAQIIDQIPIMSVWHALGGGERRRGRGQAFWRRGDGWSVSVSDERGAWYDHRDGIGGGVLDLILHVRGGSRADALRWLADWRGVRLDGDTPLSREDQRRYTQARRNAPELRAAAKTWFIERREELEWAKADALARGDDAALETAAREHYRLGTLRRDGVAVVREYLRARREHPEHTTALLQDGERWRTISKALVTLLVARWAREAGPLEASA